ncbi:quinol monooxygenase YgiN [Pseudoduganella flava]|uniref:Antibiotic biosynthesis monooxygenase n=1 Tax=Pseudoduganella flava TaxID=871742 RepID=A0A562P985_9BURK|nr:putative quinol monooxygenase [Pseudoduganella flava]QGZ38050.1 antibiotic biosynthesis monooxygenase [Pseudoduganella flava]TWI40988.1 quinol monooxygenase YgiN [Pseudoduganella flava]
MSNLIIVATLAAKPGQEAAIRAALEAMLAPSRAEPGCVRYELHVDQSVPSRFTMLEEWLGDEAFAIHEASPHFQNFLTDVVGKAEISLAKLTRIA